MAVQMLYQWDLGGRPPTTQIFRSFDQVTYLLRSEVEGDEETEAPEVSAEDLATAEEAFEFARELVSGAAGRLEEIDGVLTSQADNWRLERMPPVDRNILRLAIYEMLHEPETPKLVVLDEAIELAKRFGSDQSGRFVNGLLDGLLRDRGWIQRTGRGDRPPETQARDTKDTEDAEDIQDNGKTS